LLTNRSIFVISLFMFLALTSCGKKAPPMPKGAPMPETVGDFRGEVRDSVLFLSFIAPARSIGETSGAGSQTWAGFQILKSCTGCGGSLEPWREIRLTDKSGYTIYKGRLYFYDDDLMPGLDYTYRAVPFAETAIQGAASNMFTIKWQRTPKPPAGVAAKEGDKSIDLSWTGEKGVLYNVYRFDDDSYPLEPVNQTLLATGSFTDHAVQNGKRYRYEVRSVRLKGTMRWEGEGTSVGAVPQDKTPPDPPRNLVAEKKDGGTVVISWEKNAEADLLGYTIYRIGPGKPERLNKDLLTEPHFLDATPGTLRYISYYVTAVDRSGNESGPSREIIVILKE
jgi:fibronectin type 3 domain-containing protein